MKKKGITFTSTKRKIAAIFAVLSSLVMIITTLSIILILQYQMTLQAQSTLSKGLETLNDDFRQNNLKEISISVQTDNTLTSQYEQLKSLPNIADISRRSNSEVSDTSELGVKQESAKPGQVTIVDEESFAELKENREIYSRVILPNGDILFSSDLFNVLSVDPNKLGFNQYSVRGVCIYAQTEKITFDLESEAIIQVAQYCPFTTSQQRITTLIMVVVTILSSILTYFIGLMMADRFLKPIQESVAQARYFAQNVYHELFTPVTVAITTVAAALKTKNYASGLESVNEDLTQIQKSLQLLSDTAFKEQAEFDREKVNISELLKDELLKAQNTVSRSDIEWNTASVTEGMYALANRTSTQLILKNILENACKFASSKSTIDVVLTKEKLEVRNHVQDSSSIDAKQLFSRYYRGHDTTSLKGNGLGLALVKELVEIQGWRTHAEVTDEVFTVAIRF